MNKTHGPWCMGGVHSMSSTQLCASNTYSVSEIKLNLVGLG